MIKNILFDWDGTLVDSLNLWLKTLKNTYDSFQVDIDEIDIVKLIFGDSSKFSKMPNINWVNFQEEYDKEVKIWMPEVSLNFKVRETLDILKDLSLKMGILTSSTKKVILPAVKKLGLETYFELILGLEDVVKSKPNPEIVNIAIEKLSLNRDETLIVGDSYNDIIAGKEAGLKTVLYLPKINQEFYCFDFKTDLSDIIISDFSELMEIVK